MNYIILLIIGLLSIVIINILLSDNKVKSAKKVISKNKLTFLGSMPINIPNKGLLIENNSKGSISSYVKEIRNNILDELKEKVFCIISCNKAEGKSLVANNIALSLARINKKTLLIDANLRKTSDKSSVFYIEEGEGLSDYIREIKEDNKLENLKKARKYIKQTQIPNLYVLQNGTLTMNSTEIINSKKMKILLNLFKEMFDIILIDGTSLFDEYDCIDIAQLSNESILIVEKGKTKYEEIEELERHFEEKGIKILGFILNKIQIKRKRNYVYNKKIGIYIETTKEEDKKIEDLEEIIKKIEEKIQQDDKSQFDILHKELKENILCEDFINNIETNFNNIINTIEKNNKSNIDIVSKILKEKEKNIFEEITSYTKMQEKEMYNYKIILQKSMENLKKEIEDLKIFQEEIQKMNLKEIIEKIEEKNYNYNEELNKIKKKIENEKDEENLKLKNLIENKNYNSEFANLEKIIENKNYNEQFLRLETKINDIQYDNQICELKEKIENLEKKLPITIKEKKNNIINLKKVFMKNEEKNEKIFNINEEIKFSDLEEMAIEVLDIIGTETNVTVQGLFKS